MRSLLRYTHASTAVTGERKGGLAELRCSWTCCDTSLPSRLPYHPPAAAGACRPFCLERTPDLHVLLRDI